MLKGLTEVISSEAMMGILAATGGLARVVVIGRDKGSIWGEAGRILFCAMPVGILTGMYVHTISVSSVFPLAASFSAGIVSLNVIRFLLSPKGLDVLRSILLGGKS